MFWNTGEAYKDFYLSYDSFVPKTLTKKKLSKHSDLWWKRILLGIRYIQKWTTFEPHLMRNSFRTAFDEKEEDMPLKGLGTRNEAIFFIFCASPNNSTNCRKLPFSSSSWLFIAWKSPETSTRKLNNKSKWMIQNVEEHQINRIDILCTGIVHNILSI